MEQGKDESIWDYFNWMKKLINEMKTNGDQILERDLMEKIW